MPLRFAALFAATAAPLLGAVLPAAAGELQQTGRTLLTRLKQHTLWAVPASRDRRGFGCRVRPRWLRFHRLGYPAIGLLAAYAWLGAIRSGHLAAFWLAGITLLVPPVVLSALRVLPASALVRAGLIAPVPDADTLRVDVDSHLCHSYGVCQSEAPQVFRLGHDGRLEYEKRPAARLTPHVRAAARACPMRAIHLVGAIR
ncbi:ferredoxin [Amycolatopsis sp. WQ 127309]|uniref:ferredoxin n=1 Tax=Amycolatopsis sp. WQ 127309 TaxID=2932773 RepID=UPI001FF64D7F|nr:ferredoxin [Amycolatopsis sp. WQ 127309]UOZ10113.1 ferredoxin [Amycolatopsis sp. WQ 127309]